ncbi:MAG: hypothetical protein IKK09_00275 [Clostridia bacterium]|nr:hypothetical protein [Clostridia bacterium]
MHYVNIFPDMLNVIIFLQPLYVNSIMTSDKLMNGIYFDMKFCICYDKSNVLFGVEEGAKRLEVL